MTLRINEGSGSGFHFIAIFGRGGEGSGFTEGHHIGTGVRAFGSIVAVVHSVVVLHIGHIHSHIVAGNGDGSGKGTVLIIGESFVVFRTGNIIHHIGDGVGIGTIGDLHAFNMVAFFGCGGDHRGFALSDLQAGGGDFVDHHIVLTLSIDGTVKVGHNTHIVEFRLGIYAYFRGESGHFKAVSHGAVCVLFDEINGDGFDFVIRAPDGNAVDFVIGIGGRGDIDGLAGGNHGAGGGQCHGGVIFISYRNGGHIGGIRGKGQVLIQSGVSRFHDHVIADGGGVVEFIAGGGDDPFVKDIAFAILSGIGFAFDGDGVAVHFGAGAGFHAVNAENGVVVINDDQCRQIFFGGGHDLHGSRRHGEVIRTGDIVNIVRYPFIGIHIDDIEFIQRVAFIDFEGEVDFMSGGNQRAADDDVGVAVVRVSQRGELGEGGLFGNDVSIVNRFGVDVNIIFGHDEGVYRLVALGLNVVNQFFGIVGDAEGDGIRQERIAFIHGNDHIDDAAFFGGDGVAGKVSGVAVYGNIEIYIFGTVVDQVIHFFRHGVVSDGGCGHHHGGGAVDDFEIFFHGLTVEFIGNMDRGDAVAVFGDDIIFIVVGSGFTGAVEKYGAVGGIVHAGIGAVESVVDIGEMVFIADQFLIDGNLFIHIDFHAVFIFGNAFGEGNAVAGLEDIVAVIDIFPAGEFITGNRRGFSGGNDGVFVDMTIEVMENAAVLAAFEYHQFIGIDALHIFGNQGVFTVDHIVYGAGVNAVHVNAVGSFGFFPADEFIIFAGGNGELYGFAVDEVAVNIFRHGVGGVIGVVSEGIFDLFIDGGELGIIGDTHSLAGLIDGALVVIPADETLAVFGGGSFGQGVKIAVGNELMVLNIAVGHSGNIINERSGKDLDGHIAGGHGEEIGAETVFIFTQSAVRHGVESVVRFVGHGNAGDFIACGGFGLQGEGRTDGGGRIYRNGFQLIVGINGYRIFNGFPFSVVGHIGVAVFSGSIVFRTGNVKPAEEGVTVFLRFNGSADGGAFFTVEKVINGAVFVHEFGNAVGVVFIDGGKSSVTGNAIEERIGVVGGVIGGAAVHSLFEPADEGRSVFGGIGGKKNFSAIDQRVGIPVISFHRIGTVRVPCNIESQRFVNGCQFKITGDFQRRAEFGPELSENIFIRDAICFPADEEPAFLIGSGDTGDITLIKSRGLFNDFAGHIVSVSQGIFLRRSGDGHRHIGGGHGEEIPRSAVHTAQIRNGNGRIIRCDGNTGDFIAFDRFQIQGNDAVGIGFGFVHRRGIHLSVGVKGDLIVIGRPLSHIGLAFKNLIGSVGRYGSTVIAPAVKGVAFLLRIGGHGEGRALRTAEDIQHGAVGVLKGDDHIVVIGKDRGQRPETANHICRCGTREESGIFIFDFHFPAEEFLSLRRGGRREGNRITVVITGIETVSDGIGAVIFKYRIDELGYFSGKHGIGGDGLRTAGVAENIAAEPAVKVVTGLGFGSGGQGVCSVVGNALLIQQRAVGIFHLNVILNGSGIDIHRHSRRGHGESIVAVSGGSTGNTVRLAVFDVSSVNAGKFMTGVGSRGHRHFRTDSGSTRQSRSSRVCSGRGNRKLLRRPFGGVGLAGIGLIIGGGGDGGTVTIPAAEGIAFFGGSGGHGQRRAFGAVEHIENSSVNIFKGDENIVGHRFFINEDRCDHGLAGNVIVKGFFQNNISVIFFLYGPPDEFFALGNISGIGNRPSVVIGDIAGVALDGFQCFVCKFKRIVTGFFQRVSFLPIHSGQSMIPVRNTRLQI